MTTTPTICAACGSPVSGNYCSGCGAAAGPSRCGECRADLAPGARFCHRCGAQATGGRGTARDRRAWPIAAVLAVLLLAAIGYAVWREEPAAARPDMANAGNTGNPGASAAAPGGPSGPAASPAAPFAGPGVPAGRAPDISQMSPRERFDRLFNRVMQAASNRDSATVLNFTPMAIGAYDQLDTVNADARYHAAVLHALVGQDAQALALADTIAATEPGHLFAPIIRGEVARNRTDAAALARAQRDFNAVWAAESVRARVEYQEHQPVIDDFRRAAAAVR